MEGSFVVVLLFKLHVKEIPEGVCWSLVHISESVFGQVEYFPVASACSKGGLE